MDIFRRAPLKKFIIFEYPHTSKKGLFIIGIPLSEMPLRDITLSKMPLSDMTLREMRSHNKMPLCDRNYILKSSHEGTLLF